MKSVFIALVLATEIHAFAPFTGGSSFRFLPHHESNKFSGDGKTVMMVLGDSIDEGQENDDYDPFDDILEQAFSRREAIKNKAEAIMKEEQERVANLQLAALEKVRASKKDAGVDDSKKEKNIAARTDLLNVADLLTTAGRSKKKTSTSTEENACEGTEELVAIEEYDSVVSTSELFDHLFEMADADDSGAIDRDEFRVLFNLLTVVSGGSTLDSKSEEELQKLFSSIDFDESGTVELDELKDWIREKVQFEWPELYDEISSWK